MRVHYADSDAYVLHNEEQIDRDAIADAFDAWAQDKLKGYRNSTYRRDMLRIVRRASYSVESDGTVQINADFTKTSPSRSRVKLRVNRSRGSMEVIIRGSGYQASL